MAKLNENLSDTEKKLIENIKNQNTYFVFSTDVVKNSWIDWMVMNPEISGTNTVPLERFIAWDNFKQNFISSSQEGKCSVPSLMRKFFVRNLICQNAENPFLKRIINPDFSQSATSFADWIYKILPSLNLWYEKYSAFTKNDSSEAEIQKNDEENQDYLELYNRYSAFLEKNNMFEPSWIQPDFSGEVNKKFIIFYPEILEDYADYVEILKNTPNIETINLPPLTDDDSEIPLCYKYTDARKELRRTILQIRKIVHPEEFGEEEAAKKVRWDEISLSVPNLEVYRPYLERELTKYNIPFVIRAGLPLTNNCAGQIFSDLYNCFQKNFSYNSIRSLLQNEYVPWKVKNDDDKISTDFTVLRENLIREGNRLRCVFSYSEKDLGNIDIWEEALKRIPTDRMEYNFYMELKENINSICKANSFENVEKAWKIFKDKFLDEGSYSKTANDILGHCITKLKEMIEIEQKYGEVNQFTLGNHFEFFLNELQSKTYTPQNKTVGINVYPYKLSAPAKFPYQFVINASQKNLEVPFKRLSFLSTEKRSILGLLEEDKKFNASQSFIRLYNLHCNKNQVNFSFCEDSFDGFAIAHTFLKLSDDKNPNSDLDKYDFYLNEKNLISDSEKIDFDTNNYSSLKLTQAQKNQFEIWSKTNSTADEIYVPSDELIEKINDVLVIKRQKNNPERTNLVFTQADMKKFFPCPRKWILSSVLHLTEDSLDTDLLKPFDMGNTNHMILEDFMNSHKDKALPTTNEDGRFENEEEIINQIKAIAKNVITTKTEYSDSPLVVTMLTSQIDSMTKILMDFLHKFCKLRQIKNGISKTTSTEGFGGYIVKDVEAKKAISDDEYDLYGKIDLILAPPPESEDTGWTIIDYKNSTIPNKSDIRVKDNQILSDFQVPMYISLLTKHHPESSELEIALEKIDYAGFEGITSGNRSSAIDKDKAEHNSEDFIPTMREFRTYLSEFKQSVLNKELEPKTFRNNGNQENNIKNHFDLDTIDDCNKCQFNPICRYNYTIGKRQIKTVTQQRVENNANTN